MLSCFADNSCHEAGLRCQSKSCAGSWALAGFCLRQRGQQQNQRCQTHDKPPVLADIKRAQVSAAKSVLHLHVSSSARAQALAPEITRISDDLD